MIFPILKKIGYFFCALDFACIDVVLIYKIIENYCKYSSYTILNWEGCRYIAMLLAFAWCAYYFFSEFREVNLKEEVKCSKVELWMEIKAIVKGIVLLILFGLVLWGFFCFVATVIWTVDSFPDFLLHYIHYGPSIDLYNKIIPEGVLVKPKEAIYILMMAGVFAFVCFSVAICFLQCFFINKFLLKDRDREMADVVKYLLMKIDEIYSKVDGSDEPSCDSPKEKE